MIEINGYKFYEEPLSCGSCPCLNTGATHLNSGVKRGQRILWNCSDDTKSGNINKRFWNIKSLVKVDGVKI